MSLLIRGAMQVPTVVRSDPSEDICRRYRGIKVVGRTGFQGTRNNALFVAGIRQQTGQSPVSRVALCLRRRLCHHLSVKTATVRAGTVKVPVFAA